MTLLHCMPKQKMVNGSHKFSVVWLSRHFNLFSYEVRIPYFLRRNKYLSFQGTSLPIMHTLQQFERGVQRYRKPHRPLNFHLTNNAINNCHHRLPMERKGSKELPHNTGVLLILQNCTVRTDFTWIRIGQNVNVIRWCFTGIIWQLKTC